MSKIEQGNHIYNADPDMGKKDEIQNTQRIFSAIPEGIQNELERSPENKWLHCFNTRAVIITGRVEICGKKGEISAQEEKFALNQLEILKERLEALMEIYPKSDADNVPEWIKEKLLNFLTWENIFEKNDKQNKQNEIGADEIRNDVLNKLGGPEKNISIAKMVGLIIFI